MQGVYVYTVHTHVQALSVVHCSERTIDGSIRNYSGTHFAMHPWRVNKVEQLTLQSIQLAAIYYMICMKCIALQCFFKYMLTIVYTSNPPEDGGLHFICPIRGYTFDINPNKSMLQADFFMRTNAIDHVCRFVVAIEFCSDNCFNMNVLVMKMERWKLLKKHHFKFESLLDDSNLKLCFFGQKCCSSFQPN